MNFRYKVQGEDFIFSQDEHDAIQEQVRSGSHALITFRDGSLGVDTSKVAVFKETTQMTDEQEQKQRLMPKLEAPITPHNNNIHQDFFARMKWDRETSKLNPKNRIGQS